MFEERGRFVWYELMTTDPDAAIDFYEEVVGWSAEPWEGGEVPYTMWTRGEVPLGGVMELPEEARAQGAPPHWFPYVATPDVDATAERAAELGGRVLVPPMDIPSVGRFAVIADPDGAVFAAFRGEGEMSRQEGPPEVGEFSWHELAADDWRAAAEYYADLFGWEKKDEHDMGEMGIYRIYGRPGSEIPLGGMFDRPEGMPACWVCYVRVDDVRDAVERVKEAGGRVLNGPMEVPGGDLIAQVTDPQGAAFALHSTAVG